MKHVESLKKAKEEVPKPLDQTPIIEIPVPEPIKSLPTPVRIPPVIEKDTIEPIKGFRKAMVKTMTASLVRCVCIRLYALKSFTPANLCEISRFALLFLQSVVFRLCPSLIIVRRLQLQFMVTRGIAQVCCARG